MAAVKKGKVNERLGAVRPLMHRPADSTLKHVRSVLGADVVHLCIWSGQAVILIRADMIHRWGVVGHNLRLGFDNLRILRSPWVRF